MKKIIILILATIYTSNAHAIEVKGGSFESVGKTNSGHTIVDARLEFEDDHMNVRIWASCFEETAITEKVADTFKHQEHRSEYLEIATSKWLMDEAVKYACGPNAKPANKEQPKVHEKKYEEPRRYMTVPKDTEMSGIKTTYKALIPKIMQDNILDTSIKLEIRGKIDDGKGEYNNAMLDVNVNCTNKSMAVFKETTFMNSNKISEETPAVEFFQPTSPMFIDVVEQACSWVPSK
ncbi:MAG: hypothetical protein KGZ39_05050 [Simkania sp.]|nr:hypothetical protein [Simkania sp.]